MCVLYSANFGKLIILVRTKFCKSDSSFSAGHYCSIISANMEDTALNDVQFSVFYSIECCSSSKLILISYIC